MIAELLQTGTRLSGQYDPRLGRGLRWAMLEGLFAAGPYLILYILLDAVFSGTATTGVILGCGFAMATCLGLHIAAARYAMPKIFIGCYAMMGQARLRIADHLRALPMGWFTRQRAGDLGAHLTSDLQLIEHLWSHFLGLFVSGLVTPTVLVVFLLWVDWRLGLLAILTIPLAGMVLAWTQRLVGRLGERMITANAAVQSELQEYIQAIAVIRTFGRFGQAWQRLQSVLDAHHAALRAVESRPAFLLAAFGYVLETGFILILLASIWQLDHAGLTPQKMLIFLILVLPIYQQVFDVGLSVMLLRFGQRALIRIEALLAESPLPEPLAPQTPHGHQISFDNVSFAYDPGAAWVLQNISCTIPANRLTAIVGPSGAGKSTLMHLIARLWDVGQGQIRIGGIDLRAIGTANLNRQVAMVFQDVVLFSGTILDNLRLGRPDASRSEIIAAARRAKAHDFISALPEGYDTVLAENGASLSGGERQRISIARALLKDAPILLLDEATASIDPSAEADIQEAISELAQGRTVVFIAHRLNSVRYADHVLVLDQGRLAEQGSHDELVGRDGVYSRLWSIQQRAGEYSDVASLQ